MEKKIAVLSDVLGAPTTLVKAVSVVTYERTDEEWEETSVFSCDDFPRDNPHDLRLLGEAIADKLGELKVILGSEISGAPYSALNRSGFLICESEGISDAFFDELFEELEADEDVLKFENPTSAQDAAAMNAERQKAVMTPKQGGTPGYYSIDLKEVQKCDPMMSTKKVLRPFLSETPFVELSILCDHEPPWLETELPGMDLVMEREKTGPNTYKLTISHKTCDA